MKLFDSFIIYIKGLLMGMADIIPGISGGTIALLTGIYERLVSAIKSIDFKFIPLFFKGRTTEAKTNFKKIDFKLFIPLIMGIATAFVTLAKILSYLLDNHEAIIYAFFFGLILASALIISKHVERFDYKNVFWLSIGFILTFLFVGVEPLDANHSLLVIFLSGIVAICAMILPGISGAFILLLLNQYEYMLDVLNNLEFIDMFVFILGALLGITTFSRFLGYLLDRYESFTISFLIGMMLGALRLPYNNMTSNYSSIYSVFVAISLGFTLIIFIQYLADKFTKEQEILTP